MRPSGHPGITLNAEPGSMPSRRMATRYISTGLLKPIGLGFRSASQMAQQCKPACRSTINEACLGNCEDECLEKLLQEVDQLRRAGNTRCAAKAFAEGVNLFSAALELKPDATQLLINRAFARIMMAEPASADEDCCLALALERRLPGAYRWRAAARRDCGWLVGAVEDMRMAARMAPTADRREVALKEVGKLEEWIEVLEESEAMKNAAEECRAREAKAGALAAEAKAAFERILNERRTDLARKKTEEQEWGKEQEKHRKQAEEEIRKQAHSQQAAQMLGKMQRCKHVEVLTLDPKSGKIMDGKGQTTDIDSLLTFLRPQEARYAAGSSSKVPNRSERTASAMHVASHSGPTLLGTPSHARSNADSSARHTMSAPAAVHSGLFPEPKQAHASSAAQSASQSDGNEGDSAAEVASMCKTSNAEIKSTVYNLCGETVTPNEPAPPFYFAGRQPFAGGNSSAAPRSATLPNQAAVDAVLQEIAQKEHDARIELGIQTASDTLREADSCTESRYSTNLAHSSTATAETTERLPTASAGTEESAPAMPTKEVDTTAAMETEARRVLKRPREQEQAADWLPRAQEQQIDASVRAHNTSSTDPAADAPSSSAHGTSPEASSAADDIEDGCTSEADTVEYPAAEPDCAAARVEQTPALAAPESAATAVSESKQEPQPEYEAAMGEECGMPGAEQAETAPGIALAEVSAVTGEAASEASAWFGNRSKSQKKKDKRKAKLSSAIAAGEALSSDKTPSPSSEADTGAPTDNAMETNTGNVDVGTCTPSEAATDSHSDDGCPAADGKDSVEEPSPSDGQARPLLDSSQAPDGDADAPAAPAAGPAAEPAASSSGSPANTTYAADIREPVCEVEATFDHAASNRKAQETEQMSASTTGVKQGRGLLSGFGSWFGMGGKQGAAPEASGPLTEVDIVSEATSISATPGKGTTRSSFDEGDYPGRDNYMKARAAHRRANEQRAADKTQDTTHHYREAVDLCDQALRVNPAIGPAYLTKAACCMHLNELQGAAEAYTSALQHDLESLHNAAAHAHVDHIMAAVDKEMVCDTPKQDVVMALLDAAVRLSRSAEWACKTRLAQGEACLSFGNVPMASNIFWSIFDDEPVRAAFMSSSKITMAQRQRVSDIFKIEGNVLQNDEKWEQAKSLYSMSIAANPANAASWNNRAYMNIQLGLYAEAIEDSSAVLDHTDKIKLRDKARRRRALAHRELHHFKEAYTDLCEIKRKTDDDIQRIRCLELELMPFADIEGVAPLVVTKEYRWVNELPAQKPALDKSGGVMAGRWEPLMDDDAEAGCTKEQLLQRIGMSQKTAKTNPAASETDTPETSGGASPTCIASGPYASSSEESSPAAGQTSTPSNGVPSSDEGPTAGQGPPSGSGEPGGNDGCGSRRPSSSYYTAEPGSPLSDTCFGSPLSEHQEQTDFLPLDSGHGTSSGSGAAVPASETSPIDTPSDVSNAADSSDSESQSFQRPRPRAVPISLRQPSGRSAFNKVISNGRSSLHSTGDGDGNQPDTVSAPASTAEPQERDSLRKLCDGGCDGLFRGELPGRVKVAPSSEASPTGPPKPAPHGPPYKNGGSHSSSQWGAHNGDGSWRQSGPALRGGFLNRRLPEKHASRPQPARTFDAAPVPEALPPPPPAQHGPFNRRPAGDASHAKHSSEPHPQPDQHSTSCNDRQPELNSKSKRPFEGTPEEYILLQKAAHHIQAGDKAFMKDDVMGASEAADAAMQLLNQVVKQGRTSCDETAVYIDKAYVLKAMVLNKTGRSKDAMNCLTAALKLSKDSHACREVRAAMNIRFTKMLHLAVTDLVKLCELTPPYEPQMPLTKHIITLAREEMAADEHMSARKAKRTPRTSSDEPDKPATRSSTPTTPASEPMAAERGSGDRRKTYHDIIMHIVIWVVKNDTREMQHASSRVLGGAHSPHMHAHRPHLPAHAPRSFYSSNS